MHTLARKLTWIPYVFYHCENKHGPLRTISATYLSINVRSRMPVDSIRNMLAVMDQNYHKDRNVATTLNDNPYHQGQVSRRTKIRVAYERRKVIEFSYIPGNILAMIS